MAVYLVESQPLGCTPRKPYWVPGCRRGAGDVGWIGSGVGPAWAAVQTWVPAPAGTACFLRAAETWPERALLPLKCLRKVLYHGHRENLPGSPSPESPELGARDPNTRRQGGRVVVEARQATSPHCLPHVAASSGSQRAVLFGTILLLAKRAPAARMFSRSRSSFEGRAMRCALPWSPSPTHKPRAVCTEITSAKQPKWSSFFFLYWGSRLRLNSHAGGVPLLLYQYVSVAMDGA